MRLVVRAPIVLSFVTRRGRAIAFLLLAAARGALFSYYVFVAYVYPLSRFRWLQDPMLALAKLLNIPIFLFGHAVPFLRSPLESFEDLASLDFNGALRAHLRAGVLAYLVVFHIPAFYRFFRARLSRTQQPPGRA